MREAVFSSQFYESEKDSLKRQIENCLRNRIGLTELKKNKNEILSLIVPHAGYPFSGSCAAHAYYKLAENYKQNLTFVILGPNHSGITKAFFSLSLEDFQTPLGIVKNNKELGQFLLDKEIIQDESAHKYEHSIEVQLPFLQYFFKNFSIVPMVISSDNYDQIINFSKTLAEKIKNYEKTSNNKIIVLCSSDLTHYGQNYGFIPFTLKKQNIYDLDKNILEKIKNLNSQDFFNQAKTSNVCGISTITATLEISKILNCKEAKLLCYYTSGDIVQDYENTVSYASFLISKI